MKIRVNITLTFSKFMALLVLILGTAVSIFLKDSNVFAITITAVTLILGVKQVSDIKKNISGNSDSN